MKTLSRKERALEGLAYYAVSVLILAVEFFIYLIRGQQAGYMDFGGWVYFICSCLSQSAQLALFPFLLFYLPLSLTGCRRSSASLLV